MMWLKRFLNPILNHVNTKHWQEWLKQWVELLEAGLPVIDALQLSLEIGGPRGPSAKFRQAAQQVCDALQTGKPLLAAFSAAKRTWPQELQLALAGAESSGDLAHALRTHLQRWQLVHAAQSELRKSLIYPFFVLLLSLGCWWFLNTSSLNDFVSSKTPLPSTAFNTKLGTADYVLGSAMVLLMLLTPVALRKHRNQKPGSRTHDLAIHNTWLPSQAWHVSNYFFVLASELDAGVDLVYCLRVRPAKQLSKQWFAGHTQRKLNAFSAKIQRSVQQGMRFSQAMAYANAPVFLCRQAQVAEQTGNLAQCFHLAAKVFEMQAHHKLNTFKAVIGPLVLMLAAATLAGAYQSNIAPLYNNLGQF